MLPVRSKHWELFEFWIHQISLKQFCSFGLKINSFTLVSEIGILFSTRKWNISILFCVLFTAGQRQFRELVELVGLHLVNVIGYTQSKLELENVGILYKGTFCDSNMIFWLKYFPTQAIFVDEQFATGLTLKWSFDDLLQ